MQKIIVKRKAALFAVPHLRQPNIPKLDRFPRVTPHTRIDMETGMRRPTLYTNITPTFKKGTPIVLMYNGQEVRGKIADFATDAQDYFYYLFEAQDGQSIWVPEDQLRRKGLGGKEMKITVLTKATGTKAGSLDRYKVQAYQLYDQAKELLQEAQTLRTRMTAVQANYADYMGDKTRTDIYSWAGQAADEASWVSSNFRQQIEGNLNEIIRNIGAFTKVADDPKAESHFADMMDRSIANMRGSIKYMQDKLSSARQLQSRAEALQRQIGDKTIAKTMKITVKATGLKRMGSQMRYRVGDDVVVHRFGNPNATNTFEGTVVSEDTSNGTLRYKVVPSDPELKYEMGWYIAPTAWMEPA